MKKIALFWFTLILFSCNQTRPTKDIAVELATEDQKENIEKAKNIFYNMYLPSEMYKVFDKVGAQYDMHILNPVHNVNLYTTNAKAALNLGVFGVDLSYTKMFEQNQKLLLYLTVIHKLSLQLGIPDDKFAYALKRIHKNINNKDSLTAYASDIYTNINSYLSENDRNIIAALVLTGGWVEAVYIACEIAKENSDNREIYERILMQKYSLKHLITLLNSYKDDSNAAQLIPLFSALFDQYNKVVIDYKSGNLHIDSINRVINAKTLKIDIKQNEIDSIMSAIIQIRTKIVNAN